VLSGIPAPRGAGSLSWSVARLLLHDALRAVPCGARIASAASYATQHVDGVVVARGPRAARWRADEVGQVGHLCRPDTHPSASPRSVMQVTVAGSCSPAPPVRVHVRRTPVPFEAHGATAGLAVPILDPLCDAESRRSGTRTTGMAQADRSRSLRVVLG